MGCFGRTTCVVALFAVLPTAAAQQPNCTQRSKFVRYLADTYAEKPAAIGISDNGGVTEFLISTTGNSWTIITTDPSGNSCKVASGGHWQSLRRDNCKSPRDGLRRKIRSELASREVPNADQPFEANIPIAYNNRGNAYLVKHQYDRAIADYDAAIRLKPDFAVAYYNRGLAHANSGQYDRAVADFGSAARLEPDHARAHNSLAWLLATAPRTPVRNGARAIASASRAVSLRDIAEYRDTLAAAYAEAGRFADAVREQARAIEMARREGIDDLTDWHDRLRLYERGQPFRE